MMMTTRLHVINFESIDASYRLTDALKAKNVRDVKWDGEFGCQNMELQLVVAIFMKFDQPFGWASMLGEIINYVKLLLLQLQLHVKGKQARMLKRNIRLISITKPGEMCRSVQGVLTDRNQKQNAHMDLFSRDV
ncbi:hypothetical protein Tco_0872435 [Tanacetum coccineum]